MRVYIATRLERADEHNRLRDVLSSCGHTLTYDWTAHGSVQGESQARMGQVAGFELEGVKAADAVFVLLPGGRGTHAELGAALGLGKRVIIQGEEPGLLGVDGRTCAFYHHALASRIVGSLDHLISLILDGVVLANE